MDASSLLTQQLLDNLKSSEHHVKVLQAATSLFLFSISRLNSLCPDNEKPHKDEKIRKAFEELKANYWKWIASSEVIGGSVFGGSVKHWKGKPELKVSTVYNNYVEWYQLLNFNLVMAGFAESEVPLGFSHY